MDIFEQAIDRIKSDVTIGDADKRDEVLMWRRMTAKGDMFCEIVSAINMANPAVGDIHAAQQALL